MAKIFFYLLVAILSFSVTTNAISYGYTAENDEATEAWAPFCGTGTKESPIDLHTHDWVHDWDPIRLIRYNEKPHKMHIENNGHTAKITVTPEDCNELPQMMGGNLLDKYELAQIHVHWGSGSNELGGSEHTVKGEQFAAEVHFVHFNTKYGTTLGTAITEGDGEQDTLAVLGVFLEIGDHNDAYESITSALESIAHDGEKTYLSTIRLRDLLPRNMDEFYRYEGSLTTPDCNEIVIWTVFKNTVEISYDQLSQFWTLLTDTGSVPDQPLLDNFRSIQPLNGREVFYADTKFRLNDHCRDKEFDYWRRNYYFYWRETRKELDFVQASHACIGYNYRKTSSVGLMPVGKLRHFKNIYDYNEEVHRETDTEFCYTGYFRVNAIKDHHGVWREYPSGSPILFHHYPDFKPNHGRSGDTLIWDAHQNRLYIDNDRKEYHALCYREYEHECSQCGGSEIGHECTDAGDCVNGVCYCDEGFMGYNCQVGPLPDFNVVVVNGVSEDDSDASTSTESIHIKSRATCTIADFSDFNNGVKTEMVCDYVFGLGICCGGTDSTIVTDKCGYFDCSTNTWMTMHDIPEKLTGHAATVIKEDGDDKYWLVSGGMVHEFEQNSMYWLDEKMRWEHVNTEMPNARANHCMVQINDCEVALIGGSAEGIDIYNWKMNTWREGPDSTPSFSSSTGCGKLLDYTNFHTIVIIACTDGGVGKWDLQKNVVETIPAECAPFNMVELNESHLGLTNFYDAFDTFNLATLFENYIGLNLQHDNGAAFVAPRGFGQCLADEER